MNVFILIWAWVASLTGCAPATIDSGTVPGEAHLFELTTYSLAQGVSDEQVETALDQGSTWLEIEVTGLVTIDQVRTVEVETDVAAPKATTIAHNGGLYFHVPAKKYVNVRHTPPAKRCFDVWFRTSGSKVKGNFYWKKSGSWTNWATRTVSTSPKHVGPVWSNANNSSGAAVFRYKFNNSSKKNREMWLEISDPGTTRDCYNYP